MTDGQRITLALAEDQPDVSGGSITYIGNATLLIRYGGMTILTDPTFLRKGEEVGLGYGATTTRLTDPALTIAQLPPLTAILLSHFHGDHFDPVAERELDRTVPIITVPAAVDPLQERGFNVTHPLETWQSIVLDAGHASVQITSMPGRHGPPVVDHVMPDVMGSMLEFRRSENSAPYRLYISGDTLAIDELSEIPQRYPDIDLGILHLGGTRIFGMTVTMDAEQGLDVAQRINPKLIVPIHYNDYDAFKSPLSEFEDAVREAGLEDRVAYVGHGDAVEFVVP